MPTAISPQAAKMRLTEIVRRRSYGSGVEIKLASGRTSNFYFNMKPTMLDPQGSYLLALLILDAIKDISCDAVGGCKVAADERSAARRAILHCSEETWVLEAQAAPGQKLWTLELDGEKEDRLRKAAVWIARTERGATAAAPAAPARSVSGVGRSAQAQTEEPPRKSQTENAKPSVGRGRSRERLADAEEPVQPTYRVRPHDTLRSIARDTLGESRRYREILELNRDLIDDPAHLTPGQVLTLPEDATVGRQASR